MRTKNHKISNLSSSLKENSGLLTHAFQHVIVWSVSLVYPLALLNVFPELAQQTTLISIAFFCAGLVTLFLGKKRLYIGTGFLCIQAGSAIFIVPSIEAMHQGGYPLLLGMTICSGIFIIILSQMTRIFQKLFPPEVIGLVMFMLGVSLIFTGTNYVIPINSTHTFLVSSIFITFISLSVTVICYVWGGFNIRSFALGIGIVIGTITAYFLDFIPQSDIQRLLTEDLFQIPHLLPQKYDFSFQLLPMFLVAGLVVFLKNSADLLSASKIINENNSRIPFVIIQRGVFTSGIGSVISAFLGNMGQSISSSNIGYAASTGTFNYKISYITGSFLILISFFPKAISAFLLIPKPVLGAIIFYLVCFFMINGMKIIMSRVMDSRKFFVIGLSILIGLIFEMRPDLKLLFPPVLHALLGYSLTTTIIVAMILTLIFRIGIYQKHISIISFESKKYQNQLSQFIDKISRRFGISVHLHQRVKDALKELSALIYIHASLYVENNSMELVKFYFKYDNIQLKVDIIYKSQGKYSLKDLFNYQPSDSESMKVIGNLEEQTALLMTQYHLNKSVDLVRVENPKGLNRVSLYFYY